MTGTFINVAAILVGGALGALFGQRVPERMRTIVTQGVALVVFLVGIDMALESGNVIILLASLLLGGLAGEWMDLDRHLNRLGARVEQSLSAIPALTRGSFIQGFVTATVLFCVGPMAILGSIQDGLTGDITLLGIKSVLDGFSSIALSSALGIGVAFSAAPVLLVQGTFSLGAGLFEAILTEAMITELTAVGGLLMLAISLTMLKLTTIKVANFLPALFLAPLFVAGLALLSG